MREKFRDSAEAIRTACELEGNPSRPLASRMLDAQMPSSASWEDAALRAGMIWATLRPLKGIPIAILVARVCPKFLACSCRRVCCSGRKPHPYWTESIDILAAGALSARLSAKRYDERRTLLLRIFGESRSFEKMEIDLSIDRQTISKHFREMEAWIGVRASNGVEQLAWKRAEFLLRESKMIEEKN